MFLKLGLNHIYEELDDLLKLSALERQDTHPGKDISRQTRPKAIQHVLRQTLELDKLGVIVRVAVNWKNSW